MIKEKLVEIFSGHVQPRSDLLRWATAGGVHARVDLHSRMRARTDTDSQRKPESKSCVHSPLQPLKLLLNLKVLGGTYLSLEIVTDTKGPVFTREGLQPRGCNELISTKPGTVPNQTCPPACTPVTPRSPSGLLHAVGFTNHWKHLRKITALEHIACFVTT